MDSSLELFDYFTCLGLGQKKIPIIFRIPGKDYIQKRKKKYSIS